MGSNVSSLSRLLSRLNDQLKSTNEGGVVVLESGDAPNLKTSLKNIIRAAVTNTEGNDGYQRFLTDRSVRVHRCFGYNFILTEARDPECSVTIWIYSTIMSKGEALRSLFLLCETVKPLILVY